MAAAKKEPWKTGTGSGHIKILKQSILETFDIYGANTLCKVVFTQVRKHYMLSLSPAMVI
jgi:hypothetical protein